MIVLGVEKEVRIDGARQSDAGVDISRTDQLIDGSTEPGQFEREADSVALLSEPVALWSHDYLGRVVERVKPCSTFR